MYISTRMCVYIYIYLYLLMYISIYMYVYTYICIDVYIYIYIYVYVCIYIYMYARTLRVVVLSDTHGFETQLNPEDAPSNVSGLAQGSSINDSVRNVSIGSRSESQMIIPCGGEVLHTCLKMSRTKHPV